MYKQKVLYLFVTSRLYKRTRSRIHFMYVCYRFSPSIALNFCQRRLRTFLEDKKIRINSPGSIRSLTKPRPEFVKVSRALRYESDRIQDCPNADRPALCWEQPLTPTCSWNWDTIVHISDLFLAWLGTDYPANLARFNKKWISDRTLRKSVADALKDTKTFMMKVTPSDEDSPEAKAAKEEGYRKNIQGVEARGRRYN